MLLIAASVQAQDKLKISTIEHSAVAAVAADILAEAYRKLDIEIEIAPTSGKRSLILSSEGRVDGELMRVFQVGEQFPNLKRAKIEGFSLTGVVYVRQDDLDQLSIDNLKYKRVGHLEGVIQAQRFSSEFKDVWQTLDYDELFELLVTGKLDAVVANTISGDIFLTKLGLNNTVVQLGDPFEIVQFYHYLHKKNGDLVPKVEAVLKEMAATGETEAIQRATMKRLANKMKIRTSNQPGNCGIPC